MPHPRHLAITTAGAALALLAGFVPTATAADATAVNTAATAFSATPPNLPQLPAAQAAATWLADQLTPQGFIPNAEGSTQPSLSSMAQAVLALAAANVDLSGAARAVAYLESNVDAYVTSGGVDGPAQLALLILDAEAVGVDPTSFGGTNLVSRLLATEQTSGVDAGLFGTEAQVPAFSAGGYQQGLALTALAAAGVRNTTQTEAAVNWLVGEQCPDGGWTSPDNAGDAGNGANPCSGDPADFAGPDTNSTALAIEGLAAQGAITPSISSAALSFFSAGQDSDAGWSFYPSAVDAPQSTDPDSTSLVIQALVALGVSPTSSTFTQGGANPVSALLSFQLTSGSDIGAFYFPPAPAPANIIATYQAVPALAGLAFPFGPSGGGYTEVASDGGVFNFGNAGFFRSEGGQALNKPIVGIASTPDGKGYWEVASDGGIFSFGDGAFYGSTGNLSLNSPIVGIASTPDGKGYWLVASDGGVFAFGDAAFFGSEGGQALNKPIVGIASTPDGGGYWEVASDGGIFAFGDAAFFGSTGNLSLNRPIVGIAATSDGGGYWLVASDGGVFNFGDADFFGSEGGQSLNKPVVGIASTPDGGGYREAASDGGIFSFGDAGFVGSTGNLTLNSPIVGIAASPARSL
jgi:hypothetical protein